MYFLSNLIVICCENRVKDYKIKRLDFLFIISKFLLVIFRTYKVLANNYHLINTVC